MIETDNNPDTTTSRSNGCVETSTSAALVAPGTAPLAVNAQGQILLGNGAGASGEEGGGGGDITLTVTEYNANGSLDTSFGTSGVASVSDSSTTTGLILDIETNGQIVVGAGGVGTNFVLARFNSNGSLDTTFGSSGIETGAAETAGLAMITAANGETVMIGTPSTGSGIILQEFHTLANAQRLYVEQDADYNVTSITDTSGNVVERYEYDPYGTVTVLNPNGTVRGDGTAASSIYGWVYLHQWLRLDLASSLYDDRLRATYDTALGRFIAEDPSGYIDGANAYQYQLSNPVGSVDPSGLVAVTERWVSGWGYQVVQDPSNPSQFRFSGSKTVVPTGQGPVVNAGGGYFYFQPTHSAPPFILPPGAMYTPPTWEKPVRLILVESGILLITGGGGLYVAGGAKATYLGVRLTIIGVGEGGIIWKNGLNNGWW